MSILREARLLFACAGLAAASQFLGHLSANVTADMVSTNFERALISEIELVLGSGHRNFTEKRLGRIEEALRATYDAVPKNEHGLVGHAAASYALHRLFVQRHGWSVHGLEPAGKSMAAWNASNATGFFQDRVPGNVLELFEKRLGGRGFNLQELAVLSATLEHLAHQEAVKRLQEAFRANGRFIDDTITDEESEQILDSYMAIYIMEATAGNPSAMSTDELQNLSTLAEELYPAWNMTRQFVLEVKARLAPTRDYLFFADMAAIVEEVGELYGKWQDEHDCKPLKNALLATEDVGPGGAGRVRLADFYKRALHEDMWQFSESLVYLRQLGAIDDSDPANLRVIIPNYVASPTNCVAASSYYMVCCVDECETLLGSLERTFSKPDLSADEVATHVAAMPSSTVAGNRSLPAWLLSRLGEITKVHGGRVPLHGRLFAQWMHYAYPRECKYPHASGAIDPVSMQPYSSESEATVEEMQLTIDAAPVQSSVAASSAVPHVDEHIPTMWTMDEELVVYRPAASAMGATKRSREVLGAAFLAVLLSIYVIVSRTFTTGKADGWLDVSLQKHFV